MIVLFEEEMMTLFLMGGDGFEGVHVFRLLLFEPFRSKIVSSNFLEMV